jgi:UDP-N-acetyl-D-mannosaminuronic acid transferase (WecB/TagA/CpsF family)
MTEPTPPLGETQTILGVKFFAGSLDEALRFAARGGLVVFPSGPGMSCDLLRESAYREALKHADLALTDSALMVLAHNLSGGKKVPRISGLRFLRAVLDGPYLREAGAAFWVMPSASDAERNLAWLRSQGMETPEGNCYIAPRYARGEIEDQQLLEEVRRSGARWLILAIGGGVQERLGYFLRRNLTPTPTILCIGAAIGFVTGTQANIPPWADRVYLGWLLRCVKNPASFVPRYWRSRGLPFLVWKYRERMPPLMEP